MVQMDEELLLLFTVPLLEVYCVLFYDLNKILLTHYEQ